MSDSLKDKYLEWVNKEAGREHSKNGTVATLLSRILDDYKREITQVIYTEIEQGKITETKPSK